MGWAFGHQHDSHDMLQGLQGVEMGDVCGRHVEEASESAVLQPGHSLSLCGRSQKKTSVA